MTAHKNPRSVSQVGFELADLTSTVGVLALGVGLGALLGSGMNNDAGYFVAGGVIVHSIGMFRKHQLQRALLGRPLWWIQALYLVCWVILALALVYLAR